MQRRLPSHDARSTRYILVCVRNPALPRCDLAPVTTCLPTYLTMKTDMGSPAEPQMLTNSVDVFGICQNLLILIDSCNKFVEISFKYKLGAIQAQAVRALSKLAP